MPVKLNGVGLVAVLFFLGACGPLFSQHAENSVALDLYAFRQEDHGGNPIQNEDLLYFGARVAAKIKVSKVLSIRTGASISQLETGGKASVPSTITNATTTSASQRASGSAGGKSHFTPMTTSLGFDITPKNTKWTISPGIFFSYQDNYISRGFDLALTTEWFNGNLIPSLSYGLRWDTLSAKALSVSNVGGGEGEEEEEEEEEEGEGGGGGGGFSETRWTHNFQIGFTQIAAKWCRVNASFQYTRQDGYLGAPNAVVTIFNDKTPVLFGNENLPSYRNRFQFNVRVRFSPVAGYSLGVDHSAYFDDWGLENFAIEPSAEGKFGVSFGRWRVWYRLSAQSSTSYMRIRPQHEYRYQTDDADLATFSTHSGGALFFFDVAQFGTLHWIVRFSVYANYRSDDISGFGALLGTEFNW